jgi:hypothetical protein
MEQTGRSRTAGWILVAGTLLEVVAMAHHPTVRTADLPTAIRELAALREASAVVHGALIALMLTIAFALTEFTRRRGSATLWIRFGGVAYATGVLLMVAAAMVSGFITPGIASFVPHESPQQLSICAALLTLCRILNQSCANAATLALSVGIGAWSLALLKEKGWSRFTGIAGVLIGALPGLALMLGFLPLSVQGMTQVVLLQGAWYVAVGIGFLARPSEAWQAAAP